MVNINLHDFKANLSAYARRVRAGETIIVCDRNKPFAELRPLPSAAAARPAPGLFRTEIVTTDAFFSDDTSLASSLLDGPVEPPARPARGTRRK